MPSPDYLIGKTKTRCYGGGMQPHLGGTLDGFISIANEQMSTCPSSITFKAAPGANNTRVKSNSPPQALDNNI